MDLPIPRRTAVAERCEPRRRRRFGRGGARLPAGPPHQRCRESRTRPRDLCGAADAAGTLSARFLPRRGGGWDAVARLRGGAPGGPDPPAHRLQAARQGANRRCERRLSVLRLFGADALERSGLRPEAGAARGGAAGWSSSIRARRGSARAPSCPAPRRPSFRPRWASRPAIRAQYDRLRLALGVPEGGLDLEPEKALPMESAARPWNAIDWDKGLLCWPRADRAHEVPRAGQEAPVAGAYRRPRARHPEPQCCWRARRRG